MDGVFDHKDAPFELDVRTLAQHLVQEVVRKEVVGHEGRFRQPRPSIQRPILAGPSPPCPLLIGVLAPQDSLCGPPSYLVWLPGELPVLRPNALAASVPAVVVVEPIAIGEIGLRVGGNADNHRQDCIRRAFASTQANTVA